MLLFEEQSTLGDIWDFLWVQSALKGSFLSGQMEKMNRQALYGVVPIWAPEGLTKIYGQIRKDTGVTTESRSNLHYSNVMLCRSPWGSTEMALEHHN